MCKHIFDYLISSLYYNSIFLSIIGNLWRDIRREESNQRHMNKVDTNKLNKFVEHICMSTSILFVV
jgi:hypothetical protein